MGGLKGEKFLNMFKGYSKAVIYRHCKKPLYGQLKDNKRADSGVEGPSKLCRLDHRNKKRHYQCYVKQKVCLHQSAYKLKPDYNMSHVEQSGAQ